MKNKTMWTLLIIVLLTLVICLYAIFSREEGPYEDIDAVKNWLDHSQYKDEVVEITHYLSLPNVYYVELKNGMWLEIRVEKGFLGSWKVVHVEEISSEELPEGITEEDK